MSDWSEYLVKVQPLARKLEEQMNRREYTDAVHTASDVITAVENVLLHAAHAKHKQRVSAHRGESYYG